MKVDRLVSIIMILLEKKRIGAQELADMWILMISGQRWRQGSKSAFINL